MVKKFLVGLGVLLVAGISLADYVPSAAFTATGPQGRPLIGGSITVTTSAGAPATVYGDASGGAFSATVPATGIVQFYADPGSYNVNVSASGVTRAYSVNIPAGADALTPSDFGTDTPGLLQRLTSSTYGILKTHYAVGLAPTVNDDSTQGYDVGSMWVDSFNENFYVAIDVQPGAANWKCTTCSSGSVTPGTIVGQVPYWDGAEYTTGAGLWENATQAGVGAGKLTDPLAQLQISNAALPLMSIYNTSGSITTSSVLGYLGFGGLDSSATPRIGAGIIGRAIALWDATSTHAPSSLDFIAQNSTGTSGNSKVLRIQPGIAIFGNTIADTPTNHTAALATEGAEIYDSTAAKSVSLTVPTGLDVTSRVIVFPTDAGSSGQALTTDGNSTPTTLSWASFAASIHAASHNIGGGDEVAYYGKVYDEGSVLTQRRELNFTGAGVTCTDSGGKTKCDIPNSGGGSGVTSINTDTTAAQLLAVGTSGTDFAVVDNLSGTHTFNLPTASASARGVVSTGTQTMAGAKTFSGTAIFSATGTSLTANEGVVVNESGTAAGDFRAESDNNANALFVDASADSIGFFDSLPGASGANVSMKALAGKIALSVDGVSNSDAIATTCLGTGDCVQGTSAGSGAAVKGIGSSTAALAGLFSRNATSASVPIVKITQSAATDSSAILSLNNAGGAGGPYLDADSNIQITSTPQFVGTQLNDYNLPIYSFISDNTTGFGSKTTGEPTMADNGELIFYGDAVNDIFAISKRLVSDPSGVSSSDGIVEVTNGGQGQGVYGIAQGNTSNSIGVEGEATADISSVTGGYFHALRGIGLEGRQEGSTSSSSTASALKVVRNVTLSGGATMSGPVFLLVDSSGAGSTGYLMDLQKGAGVSKFHVDKDGELYFAGISADGAGKVACVKGDGNIGSCSTTVGAGGTCTCG